MAPKFWKIDLASASYFLLVSDTWLGQLPVTAENESDVIATLEKNEIPANCQQIAFAEITAIELPEQAAQLNVRTVQDHELYFPIPALDQRFEVFHYLNEHPRNPDYQLTKSTFWEAAKVPFLAAVLLSGLFGYLYYLATELENGTAVNVPSFLQVLVTSGSEPISWSYLGIIFVLFVLILRKVTAPRVTHRLVYAAQP